MATVEEMMIQVRADTSKVSAEMNKLHTMMARSLAASAKEVEKVNAQMARMGATIRGALMTALSGLSIARFANMAREGLRMAESMEQSSKWLGVGVEKLQAWEAGARQAGLESGQLTAALDKMRGNLADAAADPESGPAKIFRQLGISLRDAKGELIGLEQIIPRLSEKIKTLGTGDRLIVGKTLFGDKNDDVVRFLAQDLKAVEAAAASAGSVWRKEFIDQAAAMNRDIDKLETKIGKDLKQAAIDFAPAWKLALEGVVEVQMAVDKLLSSIRIGNFRVGPGVSATTRLGEIDRDLAPLERTLNTRGTSERYNRVTAERIAELKRERMGLLDQVNTESARRQMGATSIETDAMTAGITVNTKKADILKTGSESELTRKLRELRERAAEARAEFERGPQGAAWEKIRLDLERLGLSTEKAAEAKRKYFDQEQAYKAATEAKNTTAEASVNAQASWLEAMGQKASAEALKQKFEWTQRYGPEITAKYAEWIEATARWREETERQTETLRGTLDSFKSGIGETLSALVSGNANAGEAIKQIWANVFGDLSKRLLSFALDQAWSAIARNLSGIGGGGTPEQQAAGGGFNWGNVAGWVLRALGSIKFFADGGDPPVDRWSIVGEKGPELIRPRAPMTVIPNHALGGMGGSVTYIDARGADQAALARLESIVKSQGQEVRRWQAGERERVLGHTADASRRGGAYSAAMGR